MATRIQKLLPRRNRDALTRSEIMSRIRSENTHPELVTRAAVHALGLRFRKNVLGLPGKPDLANKSKQWAIFVHGCFWHSHKACKLASKPKSNQKYWNEKLRRNRSRDQEKVSALRAMGYKVLIVWECDVRDGGRLQKALKRFFEKTAT